MERVNAFAARQPLFYLAVFLSLGIVLQSCFRFSPWFLLVFTLAAFFASVVLRKMPAARIYRFAALGALGGALLFYFSDLVPGNEVSLRAGREAVYLGGRILSEVEHRETSYGDARVSFILGARKFLKKGMKEAQTVSGRTKVYLNNPVLDLGYGDEIVLKGELRLPKGLRNPGGFDARAYWDRKGVRSVFYGAKDPRIRLLRRNTGNFFAAQAIRVKRFLSGSLAQAFEKRDAAFLKALFLGERSDLEEDFKDLFLKTGTMHILAVSGSNIGFLSLALFFLLRPFLLSKNVLLFLILLAVWFYTAVVGWQAPLVRASVMASVFIIGKLLGRRTVVLNALGLAALFILSVNPKELFDVGFQLSFAAVFGIACFVPFFVKKRELLPFEPFLLREKAVLYFRELFWVSFVCLVVTLPITVQNFYIVSPLALLANMVVVPAAFLLFFGGVLFFCTFWWLPKFLAVLPLGMKALMVLCVEALRFIENLPGAYLIVGRLGSILWAVLVAGLFYFLWNPKLLHRYAKAAVLVLFVCNLFLLQDILRHFGRGFSATFLDVGQGDAVYFEFPSGGNMLVDAGKGGDGDRGRWVVSPFLKSKGIRRIDLLAASHPQADHVGGMVTLLDEFKVGNFAEAGFPYKTELFSLLRRKVGEKKARVYHLRRDMRIAGFGSSEIEVLHPFSKARPSKNVNDDSMVLKVSYGGTPFLLTGDIEEEAMGDLLRGDPRRLRSTVLKVPHHGAKLKEAGRRFVQEVSPHVSVVSVGERNAFRHPSPETLEVLDSIPGNRVYRTDRLGAITLLSDGKRVWTPKS
ncbi:MAG: DNA internalization-related competence protein ComEC/Rec2 [Candidatus Omnitrophica bacterium]|nr:DNA internalization-related competence protein ComEC/Rec2 [Candidatus Omnitrophota bacterium]